MKALHISWLAGAALALLLPASLLAQTPQEQQATPGAAEYSAGHAGFGRPVGTATLDEYRGGTEIVRNDMRLTGTTAGNTAINVVTGTNTISAGAFSNMSGMPLVIQNSGANVLIQNAMILHLQMN
ncbi:hypothetical protein [Polaromonas jejuensis]|uniref:Uncharacterized protein n=1 Tax=Polaromonas jejuensis TaxID=457502 RepID=A0ABW0QHN2_9BURK|nr:hypothetical protein [Polaromonas jejuensis]